MATLEDDPRNLWEHTQEAAETPSPSYSILWNPAHIIFMVDGTPIRDFKTDWTQAPFTASYKNFNANACIWSSSTSSCSSKNSAATDHSANNAWLNQELDATSQERMRWVQKNYMIYNYCTDLKRFPQGLPPECSSVT